MNFLPKLRRSPVIYLYTGFAFIILLLAFAVRVHLLGAQSLWNDEGSAYVQSTRTFAQIADHAGRDIHPPGYYWLLAVWRVLMGETEFGLRSLSAFASILSVALTFALGKRLYGGIAGSAAAMFVALNTFSIYYAQEARMYALLGLWSIAAMWAFVGFVQTRKIGWAVALTLFNAAGLWTHYAYPAVMVAQGALFLLYLAADLRLPRASSPSPFAERGSGGEVPHLFIVYTLANVATLMLYLPWIPTALRQITNWPNTGAPIPLQDALAIITGWFTTGITYLDSPVSVAMPFFLLFGLLCFPAQDGARTWWRMLVPVLWVTITLGGFLALELFRQANLKFLLPAQIGFAIWMGRGVWILWTLRPRRSGLIFQAAPKLAAFLGVVALVVGQIDELDALYHAPQFQRDDYHGIVTAIHADKNENSPKSAVILNAPGQAEIFAYYDRGQSVVFPLPIGLMVDAPATESATRQIIADTRRINAVLWGTAERDPQNIVENTLNREAYQIDNRWYGSVRLVRYATLAESRTAIESGAVFASSAGDLFTLVEYMLSADQAHPGDALLLSLHWRADSPVSRNYKVFAQLLNPDGVLIAQRDSEPVGGSRPTSTWTSGEIVEDHHALVIPDDLTASHITLIVGLYNPADLAERLIVNDGDYLTLATIKIQIESNGEQKP